MQLANAELKMGSDTVFNFCSVFLTFSPPYFTYKLKKIIFKMVLIFKTIAKQDREEL